MTASKSIAAFLIAFGTFMHAFVATAAPLKTVRPGVLTVAYRTDDKPVSFIQDGKPTGFFVDFMNSIGKRMGLRVTYVSTSFAAMLPAVRNHEYDTAAFGVLVTPPRKAVVDFTTAVGYGQARLVSRKSAPIETVENASGKTIGITIGSALIPLLKKISPNVTVRQFPNIASSINALIAGQIDGLFTGEATSARVVAKHPNLVASQSVETGFSALPVAKDRPALLAAMNKALDAAMKDGTFSRLFVKWNPPSVKIPARLFTDYPGMPHPAGR